MKKVFRILFCSVLLTFALAAEETAGLFRMIPSDTVFALGVDCAKLRSHPLFHKYFAEGALIKDLEKKIDNKSANTLKNLQYLLIVSSDVLFRSANVLIRIPDAEAIQAELAGDKEVLPVKCTSLTAYRMPNGMEFAFPGKNLICASTSSMKTFLDAKKGLPGKFAGVFEKKNENTLASGFLALTEELKQKSPAAAGLNLITCSLETASATSPDLIFRADAVCTDAEAAKKTVMHAQQLQLLTGFFINNLDPDLAQEFNKSAVVKAEGNNVRLQFLITEKLIQKLSVLAEPGALKNMMADDSDF